MQHSTALISYISDVACIVADGDGDGDLSLNNQREIKIFIFYLEISSGKKNMNSIYHRSRAGDLWRLIKALARFWSPSVNRI